MLLDDVLSHAVNQEYQGNSCPDVLYALLCCCLPRGERLSTDKIMEMTRTKYSNDERKKEDKNVNPNEERLNTREKQENRFVFVKLWPENIKTEKSYP